MTDPTGNRLKRDGTADLLKGLAVLFMIQVHIMEQFATNDTFNSVIGKISMFLGGPFCAPVFLAVMGYFLAVSAKPLIYFLKRGALLFLGGILLNTARSANLLVQIAQGEISLDPWFFILGADIFTLAGLSLVLIGIVRMIYKEKTLLYILTALVVAAISPFLNQDRLDGIIPAQIIAFFWGTQEWSYFPLFPWFAYVLSGYAFRLFLKRNPIACKIDIKNQYIYFIPLMIGVIITMPYAAAIAHNLNGPGGYYHHGILFFGWVLLFMVSYLILVKLVDISYGNYLVARGLKWIGQKVTSLYVIQWLIIGNLAPWLFKSQNLFQFLAWFVMVTLVTLPLGLFVEKIPKIYRRLFFRNASWLKTPWQVPPARQDDQA
ncbi:MAG: heparan-alpha-glucosaminide N-acetyltransferase domain-containing protein [Bacteroidota bacterium]